MVLQNRVLHDEQNLPYKEVVNSDGGRILFTRGNKKMCFAIQKLTRSTSAMTPENFPSVKCPPRE
ncbi:hypothetical protein EBJ43_23560 [Escherichia coli]|nr:hypothetical protein [Escherichia coli]